MAHLLEHLVFKGRPSSRRLESLARPRGQLQRHHLVDRTNYFETLPPPTKPRLRHRSSSRPAGQQLRPPRDLLSEFTVVRNEFERGENSPQRS
jgi:zinc protease